MTLSEWLNKIPRPATSNRTVTIDFDALERLFNSHEALVHALEEARDYMISRGTYRGVKTTVDTALALAEGEAI